MDISNNETEVTDPAGHGAFKGLETIQPKPGRGGARPGAGRKPGSGTRVMASAPAVPKEPFKPEDVRPLIEVPFKLASVALHSDAVDLEEDEAARLSAVGARAATEWLEISPKGLSLAIFGTALSQVILAKVILYREEQRQKREAPKDVPSAT